MASKVSGSREPERTCGVASCSFQNSQKGSRSSVQLSEKDIPGASVSGRDSSTVVELKHWLKCRG